MEKAQLLPGLLPALLPTGSAPLDPTVNPARAAPADKYFMTGTTRHTFVFDERPDVSEQLLRAWNIAEAASAADVATMGSISFADDKKIGPLQCADLVAWHTPQGSL